MSNPASIEPVPGVAGLSRTAKPEAPRTGFLKLERNELVPELEQSIFEAIVSQLTPESFSAYPALRPLYEDLARHLSVEPSQVLLGAGSDWLIRACFDTFCAPGDHVVIPVPTYGMYEVYAAIRGARISRVELGSDFELPIAPIADLLATKPRLLCLANPNGATGTHTARAQLEPLIELAGRTGTVVALDEAYVDYVDDDWLSGLDRHPHLLLIRTFSKAGGIAGLRVGYAIGAPELVELVGRVRPNVEINQVGALAARHLTNHPDLITQHVKSSLEGKELLASGLENLGFDVRRGHANFIQVRLGDRRADIVAGLKGHEILVKGHVDAGILEPWTRVTIGPPPVMVSVLRVVADLARNGVAGD